MTNHIPTYGLRKVDSAQKILIDIALVSRRVVNTLVKCDGRKTVESFQLDKIVASSSAVLVTLNDALFLKQCTVDDRLVDWLNGEEPQICLDTLNQMNTLLNATHLNNGGVENFFQASRGCIAPIKDKNNEVIRVFQKSKDCFHFLLTTDVWNNESGAQRQARTSSHHNVLCTKVSFDGVTQVMQPVQHVETSGKQAIDSGKLKIVLEWLNAWKCRDIHERTTLLRQPDTCTWLLNTKAYLRWRNTKNSFLWLNGKAGAGKSVLAASVIDNLEGALQDGEVVAFFYCDFRNERSTSATEVMRSVLSQLLRQLDRNTVNPGDVIDQLLTQKDGGASTISNIARLTRHISRAAKQFNQPPLVVIDALDECKDREELLDAFKELNKSGGVRLFVTSRPLQVIRECFSGLPSISMDTMRYEVSADIKLHVTRVLDSHRRLRIMDASLKEEISSVLCEKADGMFRWVQCQLSVLKQCVTIVRVREALNDLPNDLNATYERILLGINKDEEGDVVRHTLEWLVAALKPMRLSQIMESLSIDLPSRMLDHDSRPVHGPALLDAMGSLVTYDELTDIVILSHFSVKEYLVGESTRCKYPGHHINEQAAHTQLALLCMCYISAYMKCSQRSSGYDGVSYAITIRCKSSVTIPSRSAMPLSEPHPLLEYVQLCGFDHLHHVNPGNKVVLRAIETLQSDVGRYPSDWERLCERTYCFSSDWPTLRHDLALYILIAFAQEPLLRSYIGRLKVQLKDGTNPLIYAAHFCRVEHARTLLSCGVSLDRRGWGIDPNLHQVLPLEVAVDRQNRLMIDLFLTEGSPVPHELFRDALGKGYCKFSASTVTKLLQTDQFAEWAADIRDEGRFLRALDPQRYYEHPEYGASDQDIEAIRRRLVQIGCDPSAHFDETWLRHAACAGHVSTVKHMLASNIPVPPDILLDASRSRRSNCAMIRLFLNRGCDVNTISPIGNTALHLVMVSELPEDHCLESVQTLVNAGCNPSTHNLLDETPLHLAASFPTYFSVVKYLLSRQTPLPHDILLWKHVPTGFFHRLPNLSPALIIHFLIGEGANVHVYSANGCTPHHLLLAKSSLVSPHDFLECTKALVDADCNPCLPNAFGETPFDIAAREGHLPVVEYFFSLGLLPSPSILLSVSSSNTSNTSSMIKLLINKGISIHTTSSLNEDTVLHLSMTAYIEVDCLQRVKILVNAGCDPCACNASGKTPFHIAAEQRYFSVMDYLISVGTPVPSDIMLAVFTRGDELRFWSCYPTIRFLLENGGDTHVLTEHGDSLLHLAATIYLRHESLEVVKLLVRSGCSPRALNSAHETPLHIAARHGNIPVIDFLLSLNIPLPSDILLAASNGNSEKANLICFLVDNGADACVVSTNGDTPLHLILGGYGDEDDRLECVKILIDAGCDPRSQNIAGKTPLHTAATYGFVAILDYLLSRDIPLPHDIYLASTRTVRFLLQKEVDVQSITTNYGDTTTLMGWDLPVHDDDDLDRARFLISLGWDLSARNLAGETAIHVVARQGNMSTLKYLLSHVSLPADILLAAVPNEERACMGTTAPLVHFLIREGADMNPTTPNGDTPLHLALRSRLSLPHEFPYLDHRNDLCKLIETLLNYGSDPCIRNACGETPFDLAASKGRFFNDNFLRLVRNAQARVQRSHS